MRIFVTNASLCQSKEDFFQRLETVARQAKQGDTIVLREKQLSKEAYQALVEDCLQQCPSLASVLTLHSHIALAEAYELPVHLPLPVLLQTEKKPTVPFSVSIHSVEEAKLAEEKGASWLQFGHVFATDCKKGLPPRGLALLRGVCQEVQCPVCGIGGITPENLPAVLEAGASGVCVMQSWMTTPNLLQLLAQLDLS